jgi:20S proteasome alpha/beta subunit
MTLLIGIKCTDGLVIAADGATTFGSSLGNRTIRQPSRKLTIINNRMIVAVTGPVGLQQRFVGELEALQLNPQSKRHQVMESLAGVIRRPLKDEYLTAEAFKGALGPSAVQGVLSGTMVGLMVQGEPTLIQFDHQGSPECATDNLRFISLGSGQSLADPFLAFLRRIFWKKKPPNLQAGIVAATWALEHAIQTNPGGVDHPIQVMTLIAGKTGAEIRDIEESELQEDRQFIEAAEKRIGEAVEALQSPPEGSIGEIPKP